MFEKIWKIILDMVYPQNLNCIFCHMPIPRSNRYSICKKCLEKIIFIHNSCECCGKPTINTSLELDRPIEACPYCQGKRFLFDRNISFIEYGDLSKLMVFKLKYSAKTYMAKIIGEIMADSLLESHQDLVARMDIITFVPLNKKRLESRGFNQAEKIGAYLAALIGLPMVSLVERVKNTDKLHGLSSQERRRMLKNSFKLKEEAKDLVYGKNILIVDDIFTTGATVDEISKVLRLAGAQELVSLTFLTGKYEKDIDK